MCMSISINLYIIYSCVRVFLRVFACMYVNASSDLRTEQLLHLLHRYAALNLTISLPRRFSP